MIFWRACSGEEVLVFEVGGAENAGVFLRKSRNRFDEEVYEYWTICESVRTERGPRQRVVASLGKFTEKDLSAGWEDIEALLEGRPPSAKQQELFDAKGSHEEPAGWELADLKSLSVERGREFGSVFLALALWRRLGLHELLGGLIEPGREEVAWADVAAVLTVGKFCGQASELGIAVEWYARTALEDLSGTPVSAVNDDRLCRALDKVGAHKDRLCEHPPLPKGAYLIRTDCTETNPAKLVQNVVEYRA